MKVPVKKFNSGGGFSSEITTALDERQKSDALGSQMWDLAGNIPVIGQFAGLAEGLQNGMTRLFAGKKDKYGFDKYDYNGNPELERDIETFELGKVQKNIADVGVAGANVAFNTPKFQAPRFGKFGMKFRTFR